MSNGEIILYQADDSIQIEVRLDDETVWLTQEQIALLFGKSRSTITEHINNIFREGELQRNMVCRKSRHTTKHGAIQGKMQINVVEYYNLDVIISVGYRVKSLRGTMFRIWANKILKEYLLKGYSVNQRVDSLERRVYSLEEKNKEFDLIVKTSLPPSEGIFFEGQIFDAFSFVTNLIKSAKKSIILIDNYLDDSVLTMMKNRNDNVVITLVSRTFTETFMLAANKFNAQYGGLCMKQFSFSHDRFLILDENEIYFIGASLKDLGKKWLAFARLDATNIPLIMSRLYN